MRYYVVYLSFFAGVMTGPWDGMVNIYLLDWARLRIGDGTVP